MELILILAILAGNAATAQTAPPAVPTTNASGLGFAPLSDKYRRVDPFPWIDKAKPVDVAPAKVAI